MPEDCVGLRDSLAAFNRSKCFNLVGRSMVDRRPFTTGAYVVAGLPSPSLALVCSLWRYMA